MTMSSFFQKNDGFQYLFLFIIYLYTSKQLKTKNKIKYKKLTYNLICLIY